MHNKILHSSNYLSGGIETVVLSLKKKFPKSKVITLSDGYINYFKKFKIEYNKFDIIHFHGVWTLHLLPLFIKLNKPTLISPHGGFHSVSLQKSKFKKLIAKYLYMKRCYQNADCIHALTKQEANDIRKFGIKNIPIAIIPNGIDFKEEIIINKKLKNKLLSVSNNRRIVLYLSRLHESKGLELLIDAYSKVENKDNSIVYIAGDGNRKYINTLKNKIIKLKLEKNIYFLGPMFDRDKNTMYDIADVFILPSYNEGFGMVVLEAYRQKVPVITTTATPFNEIKNQDIGWYVDPNEIEIKKALDEALKLNKVELKSYGKRGYEWIRDNYDIIRIIEDYKKLHEWLFDKNIKLDFMYKEYTNM